MSKFSNAVLRSARKSKVNAANFELLMTIKDEAGNTKFIEVTIPRATLEQLSQQASGAKAEVVKEMTMVPQRFALPLEMMKASE